MSLTARTLVLLLAAWTGVTVIAAAVPAEDKRPYSGPACAAGAADAYFENEVLGEGRARTCLECHKAGGDAEDSDFVLLDPQRLQGTTPQEAMRKNREQFAAMARVKRGDQSRLLLKVVGKLHHGGKQVLKPDSAGYAVLAEFVRRLDAPPSAEAVARATADDANAPPFFDGVVMLDDRRLLRRVTLSLAGRLPTTDEQAAVEAKGLKAMPTLLDAVMKEDAFYDRLREAFNDIFLTAGVDGNPEAAVLSYEHFEKTRLWYQKYDLSKAGDAKAQQKARYKLADDYRKALLGEPMKLVEHIVRERPAVHRDRDGRLHHGHAVHRPRVRHL